MWSDRRGQAGVAYDRISGIPPSRIARLCRGACEGQWPRGAYGAGKDRGADDRALYRDRSWICDGTAASSSRRSGLIAHILFVQAADGCAPKKTPARSKPCRSEEHTYELQSLMRHSYAALCL